MLPVRGWAGVTIQAMVDDDLRVVRGRLRLEGVAPHDLLDPLRALPLPADDRTAARTWPGGRSEGYMEILPGEDGSVRFIAHLPTRYGAVGYVPRKGLFANGGWYPQPTVGGGLPVLDWEVDLCFPEGVVGVVGNQVTESGAPSGAPRCLSWSGRGERVAIAALRGGHISQVLAPEGHMTVVARRRQARRWRDHLVALARRWPAGQPLDVVVVDAPLMRRLVRSGPGLLFLSDRAFRLSPGLNRFHRDPVFEGLLRSGLSVPSPQDRALVADILSRVEAGVSTRGLLRWFSWLPQVDDLLYDGSTPYVAELLGEAFPGDPLADDLVELFQPQVPGSVVARQWEDLLGEGAGEALARHVLAGGSLESAASQYGVSRAVVDAWRGPCPVQDYLLQVRDGGAGGVVTVQRSAPGAGPEPVVLEVDGERTTWLAQSGEDLWQWRSDDMPHQVVLDPDGHVLQTDLANDRWPARWTCVLSAFPMVWNLSSGALEAFGAVRLRRQYDTRNYLDMVAVVDEVNLLEGVFAYGRTMGPLQDRRRRPFRLYPWGSVAWLDTAFRPTDEGAVALGGGTAFVWDTVVDDLFPLRGHELILSAEAGLVPLGSQTWRSLRGSFTGIVSPHPRVAFAAQGRLGWATGEVEHRLLTFGGADNMRCLPTDLVVGTQRALAMTEARWVPLRHVSLPVLVGWVDELQLSAGLEAGWLGGAHWDGEGADQLAALGVTSGVTLVVDILGARPTLIGLYGAAPRWVEPMPAVPLGARIYMTWWQAF